MNIFALVAGLLVFNSGAIGQLQINTNNTVIVQTNWSGDTYPYTGLQGEEPVISHSTGGGTGPGVIAYVASRLIAPMTTQESANRNTSVDYYTGYELVPDVLLNEFDHVLLGAESGGIFYHASLKHDDNTSDGYAEMFEDQVLSIDKVLNCVHADHYLLSSSGDLYLDGDDSGYLVPTPCSGCATGGTAALSEFGDVAFVSQTSTLVPFDSLYLYNNSGLLRILKQGDTPPGITGTATFDYGYPALPSFTIDGNADVVFEWPWTRLSGTPSSGSGLFEFDGTSIVKIIATGDSIAVPGGTGTFQERTGGERCASAVYNSVSGESIVVFSGKVDGGVQCLWRWSPSLNSGAPELIVADGTPAPGVQNGYFSFGSNDFGFALNQSGDLAFLGVAIAGSTNRTGIWIQPSGGAMALAILEQQKFYDLDSNLQTIDSAIIGPNYVAHGAEDGHSNVIDSQGNVAVEVHYHSDSQLQTAILRVAPCTDVCCTCSACPADFDCDGDVGTDADVTSFFACLSGTCPPCRTADINGDGDVGNDEDIAAFFYILSHGCS